MDAVFIACGVLTAGMLLLLAAARLEGARERARELAWVQR